MYKSTNFISAVLLVSKNANRLADFYRDVLKVPLEDEDHGGLAKHYGCEMGDLHFAIHPPENFDNVEPGVGSTRIAFEVFNMAEFQKHIEAQGVELLYPPKQAGPMLITAIQDPDGNVVEFTQLDKSWVDLLAKKRNEGNCILKAFEQANR